MVAATCPLTSRRRSCTSAPKTSRPSLASRWCVATVVSRLLCASTPINVRRLQEEYEKLPKWKKQAMKKEKGLF